MTTRLLVIGRRGQLARALSALDGETYQIICAGRDDFDFLSSPSTEKLISVHAPDVIINAAAYTAVDRAETEIETAFALNRDAPAKLAAACAKANVPLVHLSTDYVFDGEKPTPYVETDAKAPLNIYGQSKSEGEDAVLAAGARAAIIRTSWVYDAIGPNFLCTMLRLANERDIIRVVADQHGRPTWAADLADACALTAQALAARRADAEGVFHWCGAGDATWAEFAEAIMTEAAALGQKRAMIERITSADFAPLAQRPENSRLNCDKFENVFSLKPRCWRDALRRCLAA